MVLFVYTPPVWTRQDCDLQATVNWKSGGMRKTICLSQYEMMSTVRLCRWQSGEGITQRLVRLQIYGEKSYGKVVEAVV